MKLCYPKTDLNLNNLNAFSLFSRKRHNEIN